MLDLIRKDLLLFLKDRGAILMSFILPIALVLVLSLIYGSALDYSDPDTTIHAVLVDKDTSGSSAEFVERLHQNPKLSLESHSTEEGRKLVKDGEFPLLVFIDAGFEDSLENGGAIPLRLEVDAARSAEVATVQGMLQQETMMYKMSRMGELMEFGLEMSPELAELSQELGAGELNTTAVVEPATEAIVGGGQNELSLVQAVSGTAVMMLLFSIIGFGGSMLEEQESGTYTRIRTSPVSLHSLIMSKLLSGSFILIVQLVVLISFSVIFLGLSLGGNLWGVVLVGMSTAFCVAALGMLVASLSTTRKQLQGTGTLIIILMSALGGSMIPLFMMPDEMEVFSYFSVNYWSVEAFYDLLWFDFELAAFLQKVMVLLIAGAVMLVLSYQITKRRMVTSRTRAAA